MIEGPLIPGDRNVKWLSECNENWKYKPLKYICKINNRTLSENTDPDLEFEYIDISSVNSEGKIIHKEKMKYIDSPSRARRILSSGDVIISTVRTYLKAITFIDKIDGSIICSTGFAVISPGKTVIPEFLAYWVRSTYFIDEIVARSVGVSYPAINSTEIGSLPFPLLRLDKQKEIADFLDRETGRVDQLIEKKVRQIELLQEKRAALIGQAVTRGLDPTVKTKDPHIPWLGPIPQHWEVLEAKFGFSIQLGKMLQNEPNRDEDKLVPYLKALNVLWEKTDTTDLNEMWASVDDIKKYEVKDGDLLVCEGGEVGRAGILKDSPTPCIIQNALHRVRPKNSNNLKYLMFLLEAAGDRGWFDILCSKATIAHFTGEKFGWLKIILPPVSEQDLIVEFIQQKINKIDRLIGKIGESVERLGEYRGALISAAVTGKIDVRE